MSTDIRATRSVSLLIRGEPASKANSRIVRIIRGRVLNMKGHKAQAYKKTFLSQCPTLPRLLEGDLRVTMTIHYASRRPDLDESLILDLMQDKIYQNDRQVKERHVYWRLDPSDPRADILVSEIPADQCPDSDRKGRGSRIGGRKK